MILIECFAFDCSISGVTSVSQDSLQPHYHHQDQ
jgi:hypothetical protein